LCNHAIYPIIIRW